MKHLVLLGSTGSIGRQTLDVLRAHPGEFRVIALSAHDSTALFQKQVSEFCPRHALQTSQCENPEAELMRLAALPEADIVVNALAGEAGLMPTLAACRVGKRIALANKESMVMEGERIMKEAVQSGTEIRPIDSELSALWSILRGRNILRQAQDDITKIILTASGGPFFGKTRQELASVTPEQALNHPTWKMGKKVTIDSATLMNKAFEIIEARWLFDVAPEKIEVVIHRQSMVHALVEFTDGSTQAVLSPPDMRIPITQALGIFPRTPASAVRLDFGALNLSFQKPDLAIFEAPTLAYEVLRAGAQMPKILCQADEFAVTQFLEGKISFLEIYDILKEALQKAKSWHSVAARAPTHNS